MKPRQPIGDWFFFVLLGLIFAGVGWMAWKNPKWKKQAGSYDRIDYVEMYCSELEGKVAELEAKLRRLEMDADEVDSRINELENK